jgi:hypothetical protein
MKLRVLAFAGGLGLALGAAAAPHEHGVGRLEVAVDGRTLTIELRLPAEDLVGFERAPRTDAERARIEERRKALADAALFAPASDAACKPLGTPAVEPPVFAARGKEEHADFVATYRFDCANPGALADIEQRVFKAFPRIKQLRVQAVTARGQKQATLTHGRPRLAL